MVARLTLGKKKYHQVESRMHEIIEQSEHIRAHLQAAVSRDSQAFTEVMNALHLPKDSPAQIETRNQALEQATLRAAEVPLEVAAWSSQILDLAVEVAETGNVNAISDAASAATLAQAAMNSAALNVRTNAATLQDQAQASRLRDQFVELDNQIERANGDLRRILIERAGLPA